MDLNKLIKFGAFSSMFVASVVTGIVAGELKGSAAVKAQSERGDKILQALQADQLTADNKKALQKMTDSVEPVVKNLVAVLQVNEDDNYLFQQSYIEGTTVQEAAQALHTILKDGGEGLNDQEVKADRDYANRKLEDVDSSADEILDNAAIAKKSLKSKNADGSGGVESGDDFKARVEKLDSQHDNLTSLVFGEKCEITGLDEFKSQLDELNSQYTELKDQEKVATRAASILDSDKILLKVVVEKGDKESERFMEINIADLVVPKKLADKKVKDVESDIKILKGKKIAVEIEEVTDEEAGVKDDDSELIAEAKIREAATKKVLLAKAEAKAEAAAQEKETGKKAKEVMELTDTHKEILEQYGLDLSELSQGGETLEVKSILLEREDKVDGGKINQEEMIEELVTAIAQASREIKAESEQERDTSAYDDLAATFKTTIDEFEASVAGNDCVKNIDSVERFLSEPEAKIVDDKTRNGTDANLEKDPTVEGGDEEVIVEEVPTRSVTNKTEAYRTDSI